MQVCRHALFHSRLLQERDQAGAPEGKLSRRAPLYEALEVTREQAKAASSDSAHEQQRQLIQTITEHLLEQVRARGPCHRKKRPVSPVKEACFNRERGPGHS